MDDVEAFLFTDWENSRSQPTGRRHHISVGRQPEISVIEGMPTLAMERFVCGIPQPAARIWSGEHRVPASRRHWSI